MSFSSNSSVYRKNKILEEALPLNVQSFWQDTLGFLARLLREVLGGDRFDEEDTNAKMIL